MSSTRGSLVVSAEHELLLCCARVEPGPKHRERIGKLVENGLSWDLVALEAEAHSIVPLLYRNLGQDARALCPPNLLGRWHDTAHVTLRANGRLIAELNEIAAQFDREGIPWATFKGPVAAVAHYGNLGLRSSIDLDLLVPRRHAARAGAVLADLGYTPHPALRPGWGEVHARVFCERLYCRVQPRSLIDLHWGLLRGGYSFAPDIEAWWGRLEPVMIGPLKVLTLGPEDTLILLCLHGAKHEWSYLSSICDLAEFLRSRPSLEWDRVLAWADLKGGARLLHLGLGLAQRLLDAPLPLEILDRLRRDQRAGRLVDEAIRNLWLPACRAEDRFVAAWRRIFYRAMERGGDRRRYLRDAVLTPNAVDWQMLPLPASLAPVYYGVRPFRLLRDAIRGVVMNLSGRGRLS